ncbi:MAG: hypothetical protein Q9168_007508 [Polycauliona sp. 1 TL-2023]
MLTGLRIKGAHEASQWVSPHTPPQSELLHGPDIARAVSSISVAVDPEQWRPTIKPSLNLPESDSTVEVSIINTTTDIVVPAWAFVQPVLKGHETMNMPTFAFLVKNKKLGKNIMFDLGCRKDWWNFAPAAYNSIKNGIPALNVPKNINEILEEGGEDMGSFGVTGIG